MRPFLPLLRGLFGCGTNKGAERRRCGKRFAALDLFGALVLFVGVYEARVWPLSDRKGAAVRTAAFGRAGPPFLWREFDFLGGRAREGGRWETKLCVVFVVIWSALEPFGGAPPPFPRLRRLSAAVTAFLCAADYFKLVKPMG